MDSGVKSRRELTYGEYELGKDELAVLGAVSGQVMHRVEREGYVGLVMRGSFGLCAYIILPAGHPLEGVHYDQVDLPVHGGFTWSRTASALSEDIDRALFGRWSLGWDYAHAGDMPVFYFEAHTRHIFEDRPLVGMFGRMDRFWTVPMVAWELDEALQEVIDWTWYSKYPLLKFLRPERWEWLTDEMYRWEGRLALIFESSHEKRDREARKARLRTKMADPEYLRRAYENLKAFMNEGAKLG